MEICPFNSLESDQRYGRIDRQVYRSCFFRLCKITHSVPYVTQMTARGWNVQSQLNLFGNFFLSGFFSLYSFARTYIRWPGLFVRGTFVVVTTYAVDVVVYLCINA